MSLRWNGSAIGSTSPFGKGAWSLRSHAFLRSRNKWHVPLPVTSNLILHIDASRESSVTLNGTGVSAITDLSPSEITVNQTTAARQPAYIQQAKNGLNVIRFTEANQHFLNITSTTIPASHTVLTVIQKTASLARQTTLGNSGSNESAAYWWNDNITYQQSNATFTTHGSANTAGASSIGWFYQTTRRNGTTAIRIRRNGAAVGADVTTGTGVTNAASGSWNVIGRLNSFYTAGDIGEILVYDASLSDADVLLVESYLAAKWDI
jgi:hypothetical protein